MYKRIIILGGSGSGKSTLANRISLYTGYPVYHLDNLFLDFNWKKKDINELIEINKKLLSENVGVIEGNYTSTLPQRVDWANLIIFIDIPRRLQLYRIIKRLIRVKLGLDKRYGRPIESKNKFDIKFFSWVYNWNNHSKPKIFSILESIKDKKFLVIKEPRKLNLEELFK
ncbi:MAG: hypothetical protein WC908_01540 [Candidatus Paceibacterota bacterium]